MLAVFTAQATGTATAVSTPALRPLAATWRGCPLCDADNRAVAPTRYSRLPWLIKQCGQCAMHYLENPPGYAALEQEYAWERTSTVEAVERRRREPWLHRLGAVARGISPGQLMRPKIARLVDRFVGQGRLLDVGCGKGRVGVIVGPAYVPFGIEISRQLAEQADGNFRAQGGRVVQSDALQGLPTFGRDFFDGVVMKAFLEHETAPRDVLVAACLAMRPGAALIIKVPNFASLNRHLRQRRWCGFRYPDHVNYFTPGSIVRLLVSTGFEIARFKLTDRWPTNDNLWIVARKPPADRVLAARI